MSWPVAGFAEAVHDDHGESAEQAENAEHGEHAEEAEHHGEGHHEYKNGLAIFLGVTNEPGHGDEGTWGLDYARSLSDTWAVGGLIDYAGGDQRNLIIAPMVVWKPFGSGLAFTAAPGLEYHKGRGADADPHVLKADSNGEDSDEKYFVMRFGAAYWFHVGSRYGIGPNVNLDLVDSHEVWVYGVSFEVMF